MTTNAGKFTITTQPRGPWFVTTITGGGTLLNAVSHATISAATEYHNSVADSLAVFARLEALDSTHMTY